MTSTEEHIGFDHEGIFYTKGESIYIIVHGGGIITSDNFINRANKYVKNDKIYTQKDFQYLLDNQNEINLIKYTTFLNEKEELKYRSGIVIPTEMIIDKLRGKTFFSLSELLENPLAITYTGSKELLTEFFFMGSSNGLIAFTHNLLNYHNIIDYSKRPSGNLLEIRNNKVLATVSDPFIDSNISNMNFIYAKKLYE